MCTNTLRTLTLHNQPPVIIVAKHQIIIPMSPARGDSKVSSLIFDGNFFPLTNVRYCDIFEELSCIPSLTMINIVIIKFHISGGKFEKLPEAV